MKNTPIIPRRDFYGLVHQDQLASIEFKGEALLRISIAGTRI